MWAEVVRNRRAPQVDRAQVRAAIKSPADRQRGDVFDAPASPGHTFFAGRRRFLQRLRRLRLGAFLVRCTSVAALPWSASVAGASLDGRAAGGGG